MFCFVVSIRAQSPSFIKGDKTTRSQIDSLIALSRTENLPHDARVALLNDAFLLSSTLNIDSLKISYFSRLSYYSSSSQNNRLFKKINSETTRLAHFINDSVALGNAYWDRGFYYSRNSIKDSSYYSYSRAQKIFEALGNSYLSARMLYNMGKQQQEIRDYVGSEANLVAAIARLKPLEKYKELYNCYNTLAIISQAMEDYDQAMYYYDEAFI